MEMIERMSNSLVEKQSKIVELLELLELTENSKQQIKHKYHLLQQNQIYLFESFKQQISERQNVETQQVQDQKHQQQIQSFQNQIKLYKKIISSYEEDLFDLFQQQEQQDISILQYKQQNEKREQKLMEKMATFEKMLNFMQSKLNETQDLHSISHSFATNLFSKVSS
jgi:hypothetical protein